MESQCSINQSDGHDTGRDANRISRLPSLELSDEQRVYLEPLPRERRGSWNIVVGVDSTELGSSIQMDHGSPPTGWLSKTIGDRVLGGTGTRGTSFVHEGFVDLYFKDKFHARDEQEDAQAFERLREKVVDAEKAVTDGSKSKKSKAVLLEAKLNLERFERRMKFLEKTLACVRSDTVPGFAFFLTTFRSGGHSHFVLKEDMLRHSFHEVIIFLPAFYITLRAAAGGGIIEMVLSTGGGELRGRWIEGGRCSWGGGAS
ncbi:hypothetical protein K440DRAFT_657322 [Wilcoxina mikolae CBS 423.85]|nr:hypothetical protein K440DRAFT_657322 [Wilcoxina mikolae CBS 423.85]